MNHQSRIINEKSSIKNYQLRVILNQDHLSRVSNQKLSIENNFNLYA